MKGAMAVAERRASGARTSVFSKQGLQLLLLTVVATAGAYAQIAVSPLQEAIRAALVLSDNQIALLQGPAMALPLVIAAVPLGLLIDRCSRARLLVVFAALGAAGSLLTALASSFELLFAARCLVAGTTIGLSTAVYSLVADIFEPGTRGRAIAVLGIGQVAGASASFALGGMLVAVLGSNADGWRHAMLWLASPLPLVALMPLAMREPPRTGGVTTKPPVKQAFLELWEHRRIVIPILIFGAMVGVADGAAWIWAAPTLSRSFAVSPDRIGAIMAAVLLVSGIAGWVVGGVSADLCQRAGGPRRTIVVVSWLAFLSAPAALFAVGPGITFASALLLVFMTVGSVISVMSTAVSTVVIPNRLRGLCLGAASAAAGFFGVGLAPLIVSLLSDVLGGPAMIGPALATVCVTTSALGAVTLAFASRSFPTAVLSKIPAE
jgi:MFS family permease